MLNQDNYSITIQISLYFDNNYKNMGKSCPSMTILS